jgi:YaiO family outer membrane protein
MALLQNIPRLFCVLIIGMIAVQGRAQTLDTTSSDGLFQAARKAAFDNNDYPRAKAYLFKALEKSPDYADLRIFLGRIYTWTKNYDSARIAFRRVLSLQPDYEDAVIAYADMEYFADNYRRSLELTRNGLRNNPTSEPLMLREAKILNAMNRTEEADRALQKLLFLNPNHTEGLALANSFKESKQKKPDPVVVVPPKTVVTQTPTSGTSSDDLLIAARKAGFDNKDYDQAKKYLYQALRQNPNYADVKIFLGRIHTWTDNNDSARYYFSDVLRTNPSYQDASIAWIDLEYWNDNLDKAIALTDSSLVYHPSSEELLLRKGKILNAQRKYTEANTVIQKLIGINRNNTDARALAERIKELSTKNKIGLSYDYVYFDKQFADPWHLASFDYTRRTGIGSITGRINYANRFKESGVQYELESYPRISNTFYTYISAGYSDKVGVFPQWRGGFSLYINLPKSYEAEVGFRYLKFTGDPTWIYTGYLGKYYRSWLFGARTYITPSTFTKTVSASYTALARYYFGGADDYFGINAGYGLSPDDRFNSIQLDNPVKLTSYKAGLSFKKKISTFSVISIDGSWFNQEYLPNTKGNQYQFSLGWLHRF